VAVGVAALGVVPLGAALLGASLPPVESIAWALATGNTHASTLVVNAAISAPRKASLPFGLRG
jgi:hypothetical protein